MEISRPGIDSSELTDYGSESFLKLSVEKYTGLLDIELNSPQIAVVNAINNPKYRFVTCPFSRRVGKTYVSNIIAQLVSLVPGCNILLISPDYNLTSISFDLQIGFLQKFEVELRRKNLKDRIIELTNGSTIRMASAAKIDSAVGRSYDFILVDESALDDGLGDGFEEALMPTLDKVNSKAIFVSTVRGKNWFYEYFMRGFSDDYKDWISIFCTYHDNPRVAPEVIDAAKRGMSKAKFEQEYLCIWSSIEGVIYEMPKENIIDVNLDDIAVTDIIIGADIGHKDPTNYTVIVSDGDNAYIVDEYQENGKTTSKYAEALQALITKWDADFVFIDSANAQMRTDFVMEHDISTINAKKSVLDGIGYVGSLIDNNRLFVDKKCKNAIKMFGNYHWDNRPGLLKERPFHCENSHSADSIRYALYSFSHNLEPLGGDY